MEDLKTKNETRPNETRSIARQLARELKPEELDVVGAASCTCANCCSVGGDLDDTYAR